MNAAPTTANKMALATALLQTKHPEAAEPLLAEALRDNPNDYDVLLAAGKIELGKRDFPVAAKLFLQAANVRPQAPEAWSEAASAFILGVQYPQALAALDHIRALGAEKPADLYYRAVVYDKLRQPKPALASYQQFLQVSHGQFPDQEFIARHRSAALQREVSR
jgi:tetratricopeptide (TPR) repeat protein